MEQEGDRVYIHVANQGEPLNKDLKDKLFSYQMQSTPGTTGEKGSGLGLAMSSNFAQLVGGRLYLDESRSGWISFCLELPLAR
jgi:signal transduction histidine kinase